jgi:hypothetical protein
MNPVSLLTLTGSALRCPAFSTPQLARFTAQSPRATEDRLYPLVVEGLLVRRKVLVNPPIPLEESITEFPWPEGFGSSRPNFGKLSTFLRTRKSLPARQLTVVWATRKTADIFGGAVPEINPAQLAHCLRVTEIFLNVARKECHRSSHWLGEHVLAARGLSVGSYVPDAAFVERRSGALRIVRAFEYGGQYGTERLEQIWRSCYAASNNSDTTTVSTSSSSTI